MSYPESALLAAVVDDAIPRPFPVVEYTLTPGFIVTFSLTSWTLSKLSAAVAFPSCAFPPITNVPSE